MAQYWCTEKPNVVNPIIYNSIKELVGINQNTSHYYAKGKDVDLKEFLKISPNQYSEFYIIETDINNSYIGSFVNERIKTINFKSCKIETIAFQDKTIGKLTFEDCEINDIQLISSFTITELKFNDCYISKLKSNNNTSRVYLKNCTIEDMDFGSRNDSTLFEFEEVHLINENIFHGSMNAFKFNSSNGGTLKFENFKLTSLLEVKNCYNTDINIVNSTIDLKKIEVSYCKINFDFQKINFTEKITIDLKDCQDTKVSIKNCYFQKEVNFHGELQEKKKDFYIKECVFKDLVTFDIGFAENLIFKEELFQKGVLLPLRSIKKNDLHSSVWCHFKNQAFSRHDNISALIYNKNEMNAQLKEVINDSSFYGNLGEKFILILNKISNNHGLSWTRGLLFTISSWLTFYVIFSSLACRCYCNFLPDSLKYFWITSGIDQLTESLKNNYCFFRNFCISLFYVLGRILIAYGIYQTISAFRKHGKS